MVGDIAPPPLPTVEIEPEEVWRLLQACPDWWAFEADWADRHVIAGRVRRALRRRGCNVRRPRCRRVDDVDRWLREVGTAIGMPDAFPDGRSYELVDLAPGMDTYALVLCLIGALPTIAGEG